MQNILFRKVIILALIGMFFGMNATSSTEIIVDYVPTHDENLDSVDQPEWFLSNGCIAYTIIGSYPNCSGIFEFKLDDLENLTYICEYFGGWGSIAWISSGIIIYSDSNGYIYEINLETCEYTFIGSTGPGFIVSLAYDPSNETLYGISTSSLLQIDIDTGQTTLIGSLGIGSLMISCDCDRFGNLYGIDMGFGTRNLYSIDKNTGKATIIGPIGIALLYSVLAYDKDFDVLYLCYLDYYDYLCKLEPIIGNGYNGTFQEDEDIIDITISFTGQTQPPNAPYITGPKSGKVGIEYEYNFSLSDPDNNPMYLRVDWGNGTSGPWQGPYDYNTTIILNHTWYEKGINTIRAQAKDIYNAESKWATFDITVPKSYNPVWWLNNLLNRFPLLQRLLRWWMW